MRFTLNCLMEECTERCNWMWRRVLQIEVEFGVAPAAAVSVLCGVPNGSGVAIALPAGSALGTRGIG